MDKEKLTQWLGRMSAVLMLALLGWMGANIYWTLNAPESVRPSAQMETDVQKAQQAIAGRHLFGVYVAASSPVSAPSDIKLNGAIAADKAGQRAYALLSIEGKPSQLVREGEDLAPGITLKRVDTRQVELQRGGQSVILRLPESNKAPGKGGTPENAALIAASPAPVVEAPKVEAPKVEIPKVEPSPPPPAAAPARGRTRRNSSDDT